jgi:arylsulfatase B
VKEAMIYVADWLPTLNTLANAGFTIKADIDGIDQSEMLKSTSWFDYSKRNEVVVIDDVTGYSAYIYNDWKLVNGSSSVNGSFDIYLGSNNENTMPAYFSYELSLLESTAWKALPKSVVSDLDVIRRWRSKAKFGCGCSTVNTCNLLIGPCLFDILNDPCERNDVSKVYPYQLKTMQSLRDYALMKLIPSRRTAPDPDADPKYFNNAWKWWQSDS